MIEPGPVHTEFEMKMIADVSQKEFPGADPDTVHYFKNIYLPSSVDIFEALGQTPDDIAEVRTHITSPEMINFYWKESIMFLYICNTDLSLCLRSALRRW